MGEHERAADGAASAEVEVDLEAPALGKSGGKSKAKKKKKKGEEEGARGRSREESVRVARERNHFPLDPRLTPNEHLFMRGLTDLIISERAAEQKRSNLFVTYLRLKQCADAFMFLYEAFNLWSCMFVGSIEWPRLAPTNVFLYGSGKALELWSGFGGRAGFYAILSL